MSRDVYAINFKWLQPLVATEGRLSWDVYNVYIGLISWKFKNFRGLIF